MLEVARYLRSGSRVAPAPLAPGIFAEIGESAQDTLRLAASLLGMPIGFLARLREDSFTVIAVTGDTGPDLTPGQVIGAPAAVREQLFVGAVDNLAAPLYSLPPFAALGLRSYVGVPITLRGGQVAGFMAFVDQAAHWFLPTSLDALPALGRLLAQDLERAERERELGALAQVSQAFVRSSDLESTFAVIIEQAVALFSADYCLLHRIETETGIVSTTAAFGVEDATTGKQRHLSDQKHSATLHVARTREILWIADTRDSDLADPALVEKYDLASVLYLPLLVGAEVEGVLTIGHKGQPYEFSTAQLRVAEIMANEAALALRRHELIGVMRRRQHELSVINNLARVATSSLELKPLLRQLADELSRVIDTTDSFIVLRDGDGALRPAAASAHYYEAYRRFKVESDDPSIAAAVVASGEPVLVPDFLTSIYYNVQVQARFPLRAVLGVPLLAKGKILGAVLVSDSRATREFSAYEVKLLQDAARQVSLAIGNAQQYHEVATLAVHDPLTGSYNRRHLEQVLREEVSRSQRYGRPLSCAMIDLDHFKAVNDRYGHALGDEVLHELAARLRSAARASDIVARFGGEEFAVILPETSLHDAAATVERIRVAICGKPFILPLKHEQTAELTVTISAGVAALGPSMQNGRQLLSCADGALYEAKLAGRNRVVSYHEPPQAEGNTASD